MSNDVLRVRLTRLPSPRDLEYFALRYLKVNGIYELPLEVAKDLVDFGYALPSDGADPLTPIDALPEIQDDIDSTKH